MYIYMTEALMEGGRVYVGKCERNPSRTASYYGSGRYITAAIKKHGREHFRKTILEDGITDKAVLCERERFWIAEKGTMVPAGYNLTAGGDGGYAILDPETKKSHARKISAAHKGRIISAETRRKISATLKGTKLTPEQRERYLVSLRTRFTDTSQRRRDRLREKCPHKKAVVQIDKTTGAFVAMYASIAEAQRATRLIGITSVVNKRRKFAGDFIWMTKAEYETVGPLTPEQAQEMVRETPAVRTEEQNRRIGLNQPHRRDVLRLDPATGEVLRRDSSVSTAGKAVGVESCVVQSVASGKVRRSPQGVWMYADEYEAICAAGARLPIFLPDGPHANSKAVVQLSKAGDYLATFPSATMAAQALGLKSSSYVSAVISGEQKTAGGYRFMFKADWEALQTPQPTLAVAA